MAVAKEYMISSPEDLIECPYESAHMIRAKRMQYHLLKCRQAHPCTELVKCPFNARHEVYVVELRYHMAVCEDRHIVQGKIAQERCQDSGLTGCVETPLYQPIYIPGDDWEKDYFVTSRDPDYFAELASDERKPVPHDPLALTEAESKGLNGREKKLLYLKKKAAAEKEKERIELAKQNQAKQRAQIQVESSPCMAIHMQQQQQKKQEQDIYQAIYKQINAGIGIAMGRGTSGANGDCPASQRFPPLGRGSNQLTNGVSSQRLSSPVGRGSPPNPGNLSNLARAFGRGTPRSDLAVNDSGGHSGPGRAGVQRIPSASSSTSSSFIQAVGRGTGAYAVREQQAGSGSNLSDDSSSDMDDEDDDAQFRDAESWIGGGYGGQVLPKFLGARNPEAPGSYAGAAPNTGSKSFEGYSYPSMVKETKRFAEEAAQKAAQHPASGSSSSGSLASMTRGIGSWAEQMERSYPSPQSDSTSISDGDFQDCNQTANTGRVIADPQ